MTEEQKELLFDLLTKKAIYGLDEAEERQLNTLDAHAVELEFRSLEITAAAISMAGLGQEEPMPAHLRERILDSGEQFVGSKSEPVIAPWPPSQETSDKAIPVKGSWFGWLGWATAVAAGLALAFNIWTTRMQPGPLVGTAPTPTETPKVLTPAELREEMIRSGTDVIKANWAGGNVKEIKDVTGDVVWSDERQAGYIRLKGLPIKTAPEFCYQLWIFDKVQDKATPIDGGTFDVNEEGEIIIPINAKIKANGPQMFAITIERHGGVVVSKREKIAALAKVETQSS